MLIEMRLESDGLSGRITCPAGLRPAPGQYLVASSSDPSQALPVTLFPSGIGSPSGGLVELCIASPLPSTWNSGMRLALRGPLGRGFRMPATARRVALASLESTPTRLMPLAHQALAQRAAVAIYARSAPPDLPEEVEVLPLDMLPEAPGWADFLALDASIPNLPALRARLGLNTYQHPACMTQVLVVTPMPCNAMGECGVCAVITRDGWALACADGPVFDFNQLEGS